MHKHMRDLTLLKIRSEVADRMLDRAPMFPAERLRNTAEGSTAQVCAAVTPFQEQFIRAFGGGNSAAGLRRMVFLVMEAAAEVEARDRAAAGADSDWPFG